MNPKPTLSVVIPTYNNAASIPDLINELGKILPAVASAYQVIFVDDGSHDNTRAVLREYANRIPWVMSISLSRNFGQHNALLCGIRKAQYAITVTLDDDLQNPPQEIPKLLAHLEQGHDVVYGVSPNRHYTQGRGLATAIVKWGFRITMGSHAGSMISAFRAFHTPLRESFAQFNNPHVSIDVLLSWGTSRFGSVTVEHAPRLRGDSQYTWKKLIIHTLNIVAGFSVFPLRVSTGMGLGLSVFGVMTLLYVLIRFFIDPSRVPGFPFLASIIAIFSGAQLFALGILGEYLARIYLKTLGQPPYVIDDPSRNH